jgi:hypothetical protein
MECAYIDSVNSMWRDFDIECCRKEGKIEREKKEIRTENE